MNTQQSTPSGSPAPKRARLSSAVTEKRRFLTPDEERGRIDRTFAFIFLRDVASENKRETLEQWLKLYPPSIELWSEKTHERQVYNAILNKLQSL